MIARVAVALAVATLVVNGAAACGSGPAPGSVEGDGPADGQAASDGGGDPSDVELPDLLLGDDGAAATGETLDAIGQDIVWLPDGCDEEGCLPDLFVGEILDPAFQQDCKTVYSFTLCNGGDATVEGGFNIEVRANGVSRGLRVGETIPGGCPEDDMAACCIQYLPDPIEVLHIWTFAVGLGEQHDVSVTLDSNSEISETDEGNNVAEATVFSGDMFSHQGEDCGGTTCADPDGSGPFQAQTVVFSQEGVLGSLSDSCDASDPRILHEMRCNAIIEPPPFTLPTSWHTDKIPCDVFDNSDAKYYCSEGACIEAVASPTCDDEEPDTGDSPYPDCPSCGPHVNGSIHAVFYDGAVTDTADSCEGAAPSHAVVEVYCDGTHGYLKTRTTSCYHCEDGAPEYCEGGVCVPFSGSDLRACTRDGDPGYLPEVPGETVVTDYAGNLRHRPDTCLSSWELRQTPCDGDCPNLDGASFDCRTITLVDTDAQTQEAKCVSELGACVLPDPALRACIKDPPTADYTLATPYEAVNEYGEITASGTDSCIVYPDGTSRVREAVCELDTQTLGFVDFNCSHLTLGMTCVDGACQ